VGGAALVITGEEIIILSEEAMLTLQALNRSGGRLIGRLDRNAPFELTDPTNPDANWRGSVDTSIAIELHSAGLIAIDESAPIGNVYCFEISREGKAFLESR
jgi:hypothetical protein